VVSGRMKELGIRIALGATPSSISWLVLREALLLVGIGAAVGLGASLLTTRYVATFIYGITATDPASIALAIFLLTGVALLAGYIPARRATKLDPIASLRE
jgi:putative ABC transport system permease protein